MDRYKGTYICRQRDVEIYGNIDIKIFRLTGNSQQSQFFYILGYASLIS